MFRSYIKSLCIITKATGFIQKRIPPAGTVQINMKNTNIGAVGTVVRVLRMKFRRL